MTDLEMDRFALRTFEIKPASGLFGSLQVSGNHWVDGTCTAQCLKDDINFYGWWRHERPEPHIPPGDNCRCGIYGSLNLANLIKQYPYQCRRCVAVIAAEGETIIGSRGLRTQYARVAALWSPERELRKTAKMQFTGAEIFKRCSKMLAAYGLEMGESEDIIDCGGSDWWNADQPR